ncbi:MAG: anthranilate synthase component I [Cyanobacteria bacterium P01_D01_bin.1]
MKALSSRLSPCLQYFWQSLPLEQKTGSDVFAALFQPHRSQPGTAGIVTLLESPYPLPSDSLPAQAVELARYSLCAGPPRLVDRRPQLWTPTRGNIIPFLEQLSAVAPPITIEASSQTGRSLPEHLPFCGGWLGWLGYDLAWEIEQLPWLKEDKLPFPVAFWYEPADFAVLDHYLQRLWIASESRDRLANLEKQLEKPTQEQQRSICTTTRLKFETDQAAFETAVERAKAHIRAGDVFQVNHSLRFQAQTTADSWDVYQTLQQINPSPFASYWHTPWGAVVSCSPERLIQLEDSKAQSRPIAGTRPRGQNPIEDETNAVELERDHKEKAEHIMLVDLERNDLGRVCEWGSVQVEELMTIERYSHVMHLVSNIVGNLATGCSPAQLVAALFPGGTITGCPKVRCMEIIEALEPVRRSLFYGSCGYLDRRGRLDLNILIRTLLIAASPDNTDSSMTVWGQVGAGIVADSEPEREWLESLQKAKAQLLALGL